MDDGLQGYQDDIDIDENSFDEVTHALTDYLPAKNTDDENEVARDEIDFLAERELAEEETTEEE